MLRHQESTKSKEECCQCFYSFVWVVRTDRQILLLLQSSFLLPEPLAELGQPPVHRSHLQVPLVQAFSLQLQPAALVLVQLVPQLGGEKKLSEKRVTKGETNISKARLCEQTNCVQHHGCKHRERQSSLLRLFLSKVCISVGSYEVSLASCPGGNF